MSTHTIQTTQTARQTALARETAASAQITLLGDALTLPVPRCQTLALDCLEADGMLAPATRFVESIARFGVIEPVVVVSDGERLILAGGRRRVAAARLCGLTRIPAMVYTFARTDGQLELIAALLTTLLNAQRRDNPLADLRAIGELRAQGACEREICQATGLTRAQLRRRERLLALHDGLAQSLTDGVLSIALAQRCAALPAALQESLYQRLLERRSLSARDIDTLRQTRTQQALALPGLGDALADAPDLAALQTASDKSQSEVFEAIAKAALSVAGARALKHIALWLPAEPPFAQARAVFERLANCALQSS